LASLQPSGPLWNYDGPAGLSIADPDLEWWDAFINPESVLDQDHQHSPIAPASVSPEISSVNETGTGSITEFQTTPHLHGLCQQIVGFSEVANSSLEDWSTSLSCPSSSTSKVAHISVSTPQSIWNDMGTPSTLPPDCDLYDKNTGDSAPVQDGILRPESQDGGGQSKIPIQILQSSKCPHCRMRFTRQSNLSVHVEKCQKNLPPPSTCGCGASFSLPKDLRRHRATACAQRTAPKETFVCSCGNGFSRRDHLMRHIDTATKGSEKGEHFVAPVDRSN
jgi:uncharacterized C2H2 Zn-finger protein